MCGINGIIKFNNKVEIDLKDQILKMNKILLHRGPDNSGYYVKENFALGHNRLSIIDLEERSNQPFFDTSKRYKIIFNGEIYNYKELKKELKNLGAEFYTNSDTEVILVGYIYFKEKIISKLQGFFSFCIHDSLEEIFFLARDSHGIKPFYYYQDKNFFIFSSEIKSILLNKIDKMISFENIQNYLNIGYINSPNTPFEKIKQLKPGENILINLKKKFINRNNFTYFSNIKQNKNNLYDIFHKNIISSTISDVDIGVLISSGLDSNIILHHCLKEKLKLNTVSIGFKNEDSHNEVSDIIKNLENINVNKNFIDLEDFNINKLFSETVYHLDNLNCNLGNLALNALFKEASKHSKVYLIGTGLDEMFGGYMTYKASVINDFISFIPKSLFRYLGKLIYKYNLSGGNKYDFFYLIMKFFQQCQKGKLKSHLSWRSYWDENEIEDILIKNNMRKFSLESKINDFAKQSIDNSLARMLSDYQSFLIDNQNIMIDHLSMSNSVEARPPFLQNEIFNFSYNLKTKEKFNLFNSKIILRKIYKNKLNSKILNNTKTGLVVPFKNILNNGLKENINEIYDNKKLFNFLDKNKLVDFLNNYLKNKNNFEIYKIYNILTFHEWTKRFIL